MRSIDVRSKLRRLTAPEPEVTGLVLSGGGARSSFQIGALRYLYDRVGITPQVITGTSAGSILASVLAQSAEHAGQRAVLAELERIWLAMDKSSDMFTELDWFARLRERGPGWLEVLSRRQQRQRPLGRSFTRVADLTSQRLAPWRESRRESEGTEAGPPTVAAADEPTAGSSWNPIGVVEILSALREVGRARPDIAVILHGAENARSMYRPGPIVDSLLDPAVFAPDRVATSGVTLRIAVVSLESGDLRYVTETGTLVDRDNRPIEEEPVDLVGAIRASCAIPAVFPPVTLGTETYVDGGVRETLPVEVAVEHLGVDRCYAVVASPKGVPRQESFARKDLLSIVLRSTAGIMSDEGLRDEVAYARSVGATVIAPELDVHDALTIDPGLTAIAMAYGYMRAAEAVQGAGAAEQELTRDIIRLRRRIWQLEGEVLDPDLTPPAGSEAAETTNAAVAATEPDGAAGADGARTAAVAGRDSTGASSLSTAATDTDPDSAPSATATDADTAPSVSAAETGADLTALGGLKHRLRALVEQAPADRLPPGAEQWWRQFERHPWQITVGPSWVPASAAPATERLAGAEPVSTEPVGTDPIDAVSASAGPA